MKGYWIDYTDAEESWIRQNATLPAPELHAAFRHAFARDDVSRQNLVAKRKRMGLPTGRSGRFEKGLVPANKGKHMPARGRSAETQFKKGQLSGRAARVRQPIGAERIVKGGYLQRKVNDDLPFQRRWRFVHLINWEALHGPLPAGMALKCLDGNRLNCDAANWAAVPRASLPRLAGHVGRFRRTVAYDDAPAELKPALLAIAKLSHAARAVRQKGRAS